MLRGWGGAGGLSIVLEAEDVPPPWVTSLCPLPGVGVGWVEDGGSFDEATLLLLWEAKGWVVGGTVSLSCLLENS